MSDRGKGALNPVGGPDVLPMLSRKIIEGQEHVAIFGQLANSLVVFHAVGCGKEIEGNLCVHACLSLPDAVQMAFVLDRLRHRVEHIASFVEPATLFLRGTKDLAQRMPEPQSAIANGEIGGIHSRHLAYPFLSRELRRVNNAMICRPSGAITNFQLYLSAMCCHPSLPNRITIR